jgi:hypothetical protein
MGSLASISMEAVMQVQSAQRGSRVWAREVAKAMANHFSRIDCEFTWAHAHEDNLSKTPTRVWPEDPWLVYQVDEGPASGIHVRVLNRCGSVHHEPLVTLKFKAPIQEAREHVGLVSSFLQNLDAKRLASA